MQELLQPLAHLLASPANHSSFVHGQGTVRDDQLFVDTDNLAESLASRTSPDRRVERKHLVGRFLKGDAVGFKLGAEREKLRTSVGRVEAEHARPVAFVHGGFGRVGQSADACLVMVGRHAVDEQIDIGFLGFPFRLQLHQVIFNAHDFPVHFHPGKPLLHVDVQLFHEGASFAGDEGSQHRESGSLRKFQHALHDVFGAVFLDQLTAHGRIGLADTGKEQSQVFIDFGRSTHGRTWIAAGYLLLNGNGGWNPLDEIAFRLAHTSQKLTGIGRQAFHIAPLSFGVKRIESQGRFTRSG